MFFSFGVIYYLHINISLYVRYSTRSSNVSAHLRWGASGWAGGYMLTSWRQVAKAKSNYFIVRPKVDQRAGLLSLPHLGIFFAIRTR